MRRGRQILKDVIEDFAREEFVAHTLNVNCAKFGRRASRILITGGEDLKVNLWAIGKPGALLSLSGFISPVESVRPDSSEVTIGAGAASGTIKNIEEAKVVRTFTGHRSSCASLDFHPFGEFLATGSSDTNMKIWDTQQKRCIHTYKVIPNELMCLNLLLMADGLFLVWDLTAGKLMHNFCLHEGPVNCLDVHPYEFLLATGSVDTTVKFWDLETFELIGSSGPENNREYFELVRILSLISSNHHISGIFVWKWMTCFL
uniref:Katanin p80 WD40 repeat-containing subunit B1 homolog n=1 Tax=Zea mays TaxID=4577 RepID=A0A804QQK3_MAIZE